MMTRIGKLFTIKSKFEAYVILYGLATGAVERGQHYLVQYPGWSGWMLFSVCSLAVFMAGRAILNGLDRED